MYHSTSRSTESYCSPRWPSGTLEVGELTKHRAHPSQSQGALESQLLLMNTQTANWGKGVAPPTGIKKNNKHKHSLETDTLLFLQADKLSLLPQPSPAETLSKACQAALLWPFPPFLEPH